MLVEIQCLARPAGTPEDPYRHIEAAIACIQQSGLKYEVGALGTTIEGEPDAIWPLLRRVHEATIASGADGCMSVIKVSQAAPAVAQSTIESLTGKFRS
jgi:uncharacterized protein YqgV (UPF0045/DUF77 family)